MSWQMNNIKDVCESYQANHFTCPGINTFFTGKSPQRPSQTPHN